MTSCPSHEQLAALLDERLDVQGLSAVETHLEDCPDCQGALEVLTAARFSDPDWSGATDPLRAEPTSAAHRAGGDPGPVPLLDPAVQVEQDSRRKRLVLDRSSRQPSTLHSERGEGAEPAGATGDAGAWPPEVEGYDILGRLGRGGMGVVYRARQHGLDRLVALKMLRGGSHADPESLARFRIEVRSVARLRHPNVVQVYDVGESRGLPFVALELLEGGSLDARNGGNPQPEPAAAALLATLARAVAAAHRAGIVHRDLKPANILFSRDGVPKVTDFGLAKRLDEDDGQTQSGQVMGSPSFMAPEQARGAGRDVRATADIYSLGAILYEMLTGRPPFKGSSPLETLRQVVQIEPVVPSKLRPGLSRDLETICLKCLSKEADRRYPTADDLADDIDRFLAGAPIRARRVRPLERAWKWARREPVAAALAATIGLGILGGSALGWQASRSRTARAAVLADRRALAMGHLEEGRQAISRRDWDRGRDLLNQSLPMLDGEPALADLQRRTADLLDRVRQGQTIQDNLARFGHAGRLAQMADAEWQIGSGSGADDPRPLRRAVRDALGLVGEFAGDPASGGARWRPMAWPDWLTASERAALDLARRDLVLLHADATGRPAPGENSSTQATRALAIVDQAAVPGASDRAELDLRARLWAAAGDRRRADALRDQAAQVPPVSARDQVVAGRASTLRGDWSAAIAAFEAALLLDPHLFAAQLDLALAELRNGRPEAARLYLTVCLQLEPDAIGLYLLRGLAIGQEAGRRRQAARGPDEAQGRLEADRLVRDAEADFRKAMTLGPTDAERYSLFLNRGTVRFLARNYAEAETDLAAAIQLEPNRLEARVDRGQVLRRLGRADEAVGELSRAIAIDPNQSRLYRERALARLDDRQIAVGPAIGAATDDLTRAIELGEADPPIRADNHARRARLRYRQAHLEEALVDADAALRIAPAHDDAALIRLQALLDLKRYAEVVRGCDDAIARHPGAAELWELRGLARSSRQDFGEAVADFTQAVRLDPARSSARVQRGWAYFLSDAPKLALVDFNAVIAQNPDHGEAHGCRGFALASAGQHQAALADAEDSLRLSHSFDPRTYYNAARIFARVAAGLTSQPPLRRTASAIAQANDCQDRALTLVQAAIDHLPADRRSAFYHDVIQTDPALASIRVRPQFARMGGSLGQNKQ